jgi:hypothetical protein
MATTTEKLSGYLVAEAAVTFSGTQTLVSLTDNEYTDLSDEIDNSTNKYELVDVRVVMASAAFITPADCGMEIFLIPTVDGTNYPTWTGNTTTDQVHNGPYLVGYVPFTGTTAAQSAVLMEVPLPNGKYKWAARNRGNVTLAGSGNTLNWRPHSFIQE